MIELTPLELRRAGHKVTLLDKLRQVTSLEELRGFEDQLARSQVRLSVEERAAIRDRARDLGGGKAG